ncbi:hypothetical protein ABZP36_000133 [Zizania latifolia]
MIRSSLGSATGSLPILASLITFQKRNTSGDKAAVHIRATGSIASLPHSSRVSPCHVRCLPTLHIPRARRQPPSMEAATEVANSTGCAGVVVPGLCYQKIRSSAASYKQLKKKGKPCPIRYCCKCLRNRYGENVEEVAKDKSWACPKCKDICNCSLCM